MHDIYTLSAQKKEEKEAMESQAFELGMKYKRLEKQHARQKEIHERIRETNASILKNVKLKQLMAAESNARAEAADKRVIEVQAQHAELQKKLANLQDEVTRLKDHQSVNQGELCQAVVTKLFQTQDFGKWYLKAMTGIANVGRNNVLEELMESHPDL